MQIGSFKPYSLRHDTMGVIETLNRLAGHFRTKGHPVIYIQHDGSKGGSFIPGTDDWKLLPELDVRAQDVIMPKTANDAFYRSELQLTLSAHGIAELYCGGCATDFCVDATIKSAHAKDYKVTVIADGHTTASKPMIDAASVVQYYNWLWTEMVPTRQSMSVMNSADIINSI